MENLAFPSCHHGVSTAYTCERCMEESGAKSLLQLLTMQPSTVTVNGMVYVPHPTMPGRFVPEPSGAE